MFFNLIVLYYLIIVLSNHTSEVRIGRGRKHVAKESTPDLLSPDEFRDFFLTFEPGRSIQIGRLGQKLFLKYKPNKPIPFDFLGFASDVECCGLWEFSVTGKIIYRYPLCSCYLFLCYIHAI